AALILERQPDIDDASLEELLTSTAKDLGPKGRDDEFGYGLVDPYRALNALEAKIAAGGPPKAPAPQPTAAQAVTMKPLPRSAQNTTATQVSMASEKVSQLPPPSPSQVAPRPLPVPEIETRTTLPGEADPARAAVHKRRQ